MLEEQIVIMLTEHGHDIDECKRRLEKVESTNENINKLALSVERLAVSVTTVAQSQEKVCKRIDAIEKQPLIAARNLKNEVIRAIAAAVAGGVVGYLISLLT